MADSVLNNGVTIEKVTEASKRKGFSKQGEMFSCKFFQCVYSLPTSDIFCCLLIMFANSLYPDQARQNVRPDLDPN